MGTRGLRWFKSVVPGTFSHLFWDVFRHVWMGWKAAPQLQKIHAWSSLQCYVCHNVPKLDLDYWDSPWKIWVRPDSRRIVCRGTHACLSLRWCTKKALMLPKDPKGSWKTPFSKHMSNKQLLNAFKQKLFDSNIDKLYGCPSNPQVKWL